MRQGYEISQVDSHRRPSDARVAAQDENARPSALILNNAKQGKHFSNLIKFPLAIETEVVENGFNNDAEASQKLV